MSEALVTAAAKIKEFKKHCMSNGAKHGARAHRWSEECQLLKEEMQHVVQYHNYQAEWWLGLIGRKPASSDEYRGGMAA
ncbi:uncharacterized protein LAESUDRAFT_765008 [Laetiporus sulphureus 93-53]|uniref:Uncharacterized protein n=1 Tax=Laetiporus sulphureus 93-53 TaxID=1314785 RepID=A0A165B0R8_9APHY|nr:uncharacterized protein LAESUDRAFT_765008 [Laetiporus sulphureus 93-53]KZT00010.1 hypothetical protein LAESUDRAFT_765008 [Laetiporus sulphureus 93-53]